MVSREEFDGVCIAIRSLLANCYADEFAGRLDAFNAKRATILAGLDAISYPDGDGGKGEMVKHQALFFAETILEGVPVLLSGRLPHPRPDGPDR